jgi:hypothetical protein
MAWCSVKAQGQLYIYLYLYLPWGSWIQSTVSHKISIWSVSVSFSHLCLGPPSDMFPSAFRLKFCMHFSSAHAFCMSYQSRPLALFTIAIFSSYNNLENIMTCDWWGEHERINISSGANRKFLDPWRIRNNGQQNFNIWCYPKLSVSV